MARIPPWRWSLWGPWPPGHIEPHRIPEEKIRPLAERLSKQRPWLSAEENWLAAEHALRQKPWRPLAIRFSGEKERSGWDWADLLLKVSVPILILGLSTFYSCTNSRREEKIAWEQRESDVMTVFVKEMRPLMLDKNLKESAADAEVRGVARGLTLAALSQVHDPERKRLIVRFLLDSGLNAKSGKLFSLSEANLSGANLSGASLSGANLSEADLSGANLSDANLSGANLSNANFSGANLSDANLYKAKLIKADLSNANLYKANLKEADLSSAKLIGADLSSAALREAVLYEAKLIKADLSNANLYKAKLNRADLSNAILSANLIDADLSFANLSGANLSGANLFGAVFSVADLNGILWDKAMSWPSKTAFWSAKNIPPELKKKLGLD
jgi:uncharacterized protein YjbI with pentapeptide repeats